MSGRERGAATTEFALLVPVFVLLTGLVVGGARVWFARGQVETIAQTAARGASLARGASGARNEADRLAAADAATEGLRCAPLEVNLDPAGFDAPVGRPATVEVSVRCAVPLADLLLPGWPGELSLESSARSVLDRYRGRG